MEIRCTVDNFFLGYLLQINGACCGVDFALRYIINTVRFHYNTNTHLWKCASGMGKLWRLFGKCKIGLIFSISRCCVACNVVFPERHIITGIYLSEVYHQTSASHSAPICGLRFLRHQMETFSASLALCAGNLPMSGEFPPERPAHEQTIE